MLNSRSGSAQKKMEMAGNGAMADEFQFLLALSLGLGDQDCYQLSLFKFSSFYIFFKIFIWLHRILVAARGIFVATCGIFVATCGI